MSELLRVNLENVHPRLKKIFQGPILSVPLGRKVKVFQAQLSTTNESPKNP